MLLYHSFPADPDDELGTLEANKRGVDQLATIMEYGLLMTSEKLNIPPNERAQNREDPKTEFLQIRACFTLVDQEELWCMDRRRTSEGEPTSHSELFGKFAIGLDPIKARQLGAVPVIYFYENSNDTNQDTNLSYEILFHLRELRSLAIALARLEAKAAIPGRESFTFDEELLDTLGLRLDGDPIVRKKIEEIDAQVARTTVSLLDTDRPPAWNLVDWIDATLNLFQIVDSDTTVGSLAYYQEREWRIIGLFGPHVRCHRLGSKRFLDGNSAIPCKELRKLRRHLKLLNSELFTDEYLEDSALLVGVNKTTPFFDFVQEIICPSVVSSDVADLFASAEPPIGGCFNRRVAANPEFTVFSRTP